MGTKYNKAKVKRGLDFISCPDLRNEHLKYEDTFVDVIERDWRSGDNMYCYKIITNDGTELWYYEDELELFTLLEWKMIKYED